MKVYNENRVWIRITNFCNSKCIFCLEDSEIKKQGIIPKEMIFRQIKDGYIPGDFNKLIISGGEASSDKYFFDYIKHGKDIGYEKIQTITNGIRWGDFEFCKKAVDSGLNEITFSIHGNSSSLHDKMTGVKGSFKNLISGIHYFKTKFPKIIVNSDIVLNSLNIKHAYKIVQLLKKLDVFEYDILQIVPFGIARENKELLFENIDEYEEYFKKIWKESEDDRVYMWANRVFPYLLEGYEYMIQTPEKISDEVANEGKEMNKKAFDLRVPFFCKDDLRCKNCYLNDFCDQMQTFYKQEKIENKNMDCEKQFKLMTNKDIFKINEFYPDKIEDFIEQIRNESEEYEAVLNIPHCILEKNNSFAYFNNCELEKTFENYLDWYENEGFRLKSKRCESCKYFDKCKGIHINIIKKYGFKILNPIENDK